VKERWVRGADRDRGPEPAPFDPVVEGARHGSSRELSLALWEQARIDAIDAVGRCDTERARQLFHEYAARLAARGGRLPPGTGKLTRSGLESNPGQLTARAPIADARSVHAPGRETLVTAESRRWRQVSEKPARSL